MKASYDQWRSRTYGQALEQIQAEEITCREMDLAFINQNGVAITSGAALPTLEIYTEASGF